MPIVLPPLALLALRLGTVALIAGALAARRRRSVLDHGREAALDALPEGGAMVVDAEAGRADARGRLRRVIRLGAHGPGVAVDAAALLRLRLRRLAPDR